MKLGPHPSHKTRFSDASTFDEICEICGAHDEVPGGWGTLAEPCPGPLSPAEALDRGHAVRLGRLDPDEVAVALGAEPCTPEQAAALQQLAEDAQELGIYDDDPKRDD